MTISTENYQLNNELTLHDSSLSPLTIYAVTLSLTTQDNIIIESRLGFNVNPQLYQHIDTQALFNLQSELRGSISNAEFDSETNIEITASLKPDFLPLLTPHQDNLLSYLQKLNQEDTNNPLFFTENWLALQVKQPRLPVETGYRTFWDYLNISAIAVEYHVDHKIPLAQRWTAKGHDSDDQQRYH